ELLAGHLERRARARALRAAAPADCRTGQDRGAELHQFPHWIMKFELPDSTRKQLEEFFTALVGYHLEGRLMIFQGLLSHREMIGAINITQSIIGYQRGIELIQEVTSRPEREKWKDNKGWKFKDLNVAYSELTRDGHSCSYCERIK